MDISNQTVAIGMATFHGAQYLRQQIDSILTQSWQDWVLFIRDDGSTDETVEIIQEYVAKADGKLVLIEDHDLKGGSTKQNFFSILEWIGRRYSFHYFMFADQDDVWQPEKISLSMEAMQHEEGISHQPLVLHTDLMVVDETLMLLDSSFFHYKALQPKRTDLNHMLVENNITGCTMLWNKALNDLLGTGSKDAVMHDWWIALVAGALGKILCLKQPTVQYRQHGGNVLGAAKVNSWHYVFDRCHKRNRYQELFRESTRQAEGLLRHYAEKISPTDAQIISEYADLYNHGKLGRLCKVIKWGFWKQGLVQRVGEVFLI